MTPRQVDEMTAEEYAAFWRYAENEARARQREARRIRRR
jgi:hypothetical protein